MHIDLSTTNCLKIFFLLFTPIIILFFFKDEHNSFILTEFGLIESLTALFYLIAIFICTNLFLFAKGKHKLIFLVFLFLTLVFFGEETSYLQHYIGYETPEYFLKANSQKEFNFHNITTDGGSLTQALGDGKFDISILLKSQNLFNIGFAFYFLILPFLAFYSQSLKNIINNFYIPIGGIRLIFSIWVPIIFTVLIGFTDLNNETHLRLYYGETREMFFAFSILLYMYICRVQLVIKKGSTN